MLTLRWFPDFQPETITLRGMFRCQRNAIQWGTDHALEEHDVVLDKGAVVQDRDGGKHGTA